MAINNLHSICGLDECGRGPLAGPLVAAAVIPNISLPVKDGKKMTPIQRMKIFNAIRESGSMVAVEVISVRLINSRGIGWANKEIFRRLIKRIEADEYIIDGNLKIGKIRGKPHIRSVVDADATVYPTIVAGIMAKVFRDQLMKELHTRYPYYGWNTNAGYGTSYHIEALKTYGMCVHHRKVFVATALSGR